MRISDWSSDVCSSDLDWLLHELRALGPEKVDKALFLCLHHAPYSADTNHGSSRHMIDQLEKAFAVTGVLPHIICSGHVHNYQRYSKHYNDDEVRSEEHTSELQSLMRISYAVFCLKKKKTPTNLNIKYKNLKYM